MEEDPFMPTTFGSPIYSINLIRPNYYIPTWGRLLITAGIMSVPITAAPWQNRR